MSEAKRERCRVCAKRHGGWRLLLLMSANYLTSAFRCRGCRYVRQDPTAPGRHSPEATFEFHHLSSHAPLLYSYHPILLQRLHHGQLAILYSAPALLART